MQMSTITDKDRERVPSPHSRPGSSEGVSEFLSHCVVVNV